MNKGGEQNTPQSPDMSGQNSPLVKLHTKQFFHHFYQPEKQDEKNGEKETVPENFLIQFTVMLDLIIGIISKKTHLQQLSD
jgi:hypothetical protein